MYRSQLLLQQLGIRQWIPKNKTILRHHRAELWRDQIYEEPVAVSVITAKSDQSADPGHQVTLEQKTLNTEITAKQQQIVAIDEHVQSIVALTSVEQISYPQTISFDYQLIIHEKFIIFAEISDSQQQKLFHQIVAACDAQTAQIKWPLAIETWDMNDHVLSGYMQGALARHQTKKMLVLGELNTQLIDFIAQDIQQFSALSELLQSAEQKRSLWQTLYPLVYDLENTA